MIMKFSENSPAYITTNEDWRRAIGFMPKKCKRVLTVAASGDQPLFCSLYAIMHYGTKIVVDTFDITINAKLIMNIKNAAISFLDRYDYIRLLEKLYWCKDALSVPHFEKIEKKLSDDEIKHLVSMRGNRLFNREYWNGDQYEYLPNDTEYQILQGIVGEPYDFKQTDIVNLSAKLTEKYDFVYLSNILDYFNVEEQWEILNSLLPYVNVGGRIVSYSFPRYPKQFLKTPENEELVKDVFKSWHYWNLLRNKHWHYRTHFTKICDFITVFERLR